MATLKRKFFDCRNYPSENNCSVAISGREDEVLDQAVHHAMTKQESRIIHTCGNNCELCWRTRSRGVEPPMSCIKTFRSAWRACTLSVDG
jgi:hypothetical protein